MHYSLPRSLLSSFTLFAVVTIEYAMALSSLGSSQQLVSATSPNSPFSTLVQSNSFASLFVDYDRARRAAAERRVFIYSQINIVARPFPDNGYKKSPTVVTGPLPPDPAAALLEADHMFEIQVLAKMLKAAGVVHTAQAPAFPAGDITDIKDLMNGSANVRYIPMELNAFKGRVFSQVLRDIIVNDGRCSVIPVEMWREDMYLSLFAYLHANCEEIMTTAIDVQAMIRNARTASPERRKWLELGRIMKAALFCMHVNVPEDDGSEGDSCELML